MKIHQMKLNNKPFNMIKNGRKNIELRLYDEKRRKLNIGDEIIFRNLKDGETISVTILALHKYEASQSFTSILIKLLLVMKIMNLRILKI